VKLFFALLPPPAVAKALAELARSAASQFGGVATRQESIHLTLAFLGEVAEERLPVLIEAAQPVSAASFALMIEVLAYWRHNHLLWAGDAAPSVALARLVEDLQAALSAADFVVDGLSRAFTPHVTLIRKLPEEHVPLVLPAMDAVSWPCSHFALVCSVGSNSGPVYQTLADFPLT